MFPSSGGYLLSDDNGADDCGSIHPAAQMQLCLFWHILLASTAKHYAIVKMALAGAELALKCCVLQLQMIACTYPWLWLHMALHVAG